MGRGHHRGLAAGIPIVCFGSARALTEAGHLDRPAGGRERLILASGGGYDALVADRMLPKLDGLGLVRAVRAAGVKKPALFLTARAGVGDRVEGLEAGGDDYLVKPFAFAELAARLNGGRLLRRTRRPEPPPAPLRRGTPAPAPPRATPGRR